MKKFVSSLLCITLLLSLSITAFAYDESTYSGGGQSELTAYSYSTYNVTIPAKIDLTHNQGDITVSDADIDSGYQIEIVVDNLNDKGRIDMTHKTKSGVTSSCELYSAYGMVTKENPVLATIKDTEISNGSAYAYFSGQMAVGTSAGSYAGTMQYSLYCSKY